jgi:zinc-ribbon domain
MSKTLRWVVFILLGLVVVALLIWAVFAIFGNFGYGMMMRPGVWSWDNMRMDYNPLRWIFGSLLCLGVFLLVVLGIIAVVAAIVRGNRPVQSNLPAAQVDTHVRTCTNCGRLAQEDWKTCPYCGNPLP